MHMLQPANWKKPRGYSNGIVAKGSTIFVAGQIGWNAEEKFESTDLAGQVRQAFKNIVAVLAEAGAGPQHICRMTWYLADRREYLDSLKEIGAAYREILGKNYPVMTAIQVAGFIEAEARVEIEVTAVLPD